MHKYKVRAGYGSSKFMIEFGPDDSDKQFADDLCLVLRRNGFILVSTNDLIFLSTAKFDSPKGSFWIDTDEWGFVWGHADDNQPEFFMLTFCSEKAVCLRKWKLTSKNILNPLGADGMYLVVD